MDEPSAESTTAPEAERDWPHGLTWIIWVFLLVFVVYPLSVGPAVKLYWMKVIPRKPVQVLYAPLDFVVRRSPALNRFFTWYVNDLWRALPRSAPVVTPPAQSVR